MPKRLISYYHIREIGDPTGVQNAGSLVFQTIPITAFKYVKWNNRMRLDG